MRSMEPEPLDFLDHAQAALVVHRLPNEGIGAFLITLLDLLTSAGKRKHDHGNASQLRIAFDLAQNRATVHTRHVHVENDQLRPRRIIVWVRTAEKIERFFATRCVVAPVREAECLQQSFKQECLTYIVVNDQQIAGAAGIRTYFHLNLLLAEMRPGRSGHEDQ